MDIRGANALRQLGDGIRTARLRRGWTQQDLADRAGMAVKTLRALERSPEGVTLGNCARVLAVLGMAGRLAEVADPARDELGMSLERRYMSGRARVRGVDDDF